MDDVGQEACSYPALTKMDKIEIKIEKLEIKIEEAEEKLNKYQIKLENSTEGQTTSRWEKLLDSATQTLHDLRQEKLKLLDERRINLEYETGSFIV